MSRRQEELTMKDNSSLQRLEELDKPLFENRKVLIMSGIFLLACLIGNLFFNVLLRFTLKLFVWAPWSWPLCAFGVGPLIDKTLEDIWWCIYWMLSGPAVMLLFVLIMKHFSKIVADINNSMLELTYVFMIGVLSREH